MQIDKIVEVLRQGGVCILPSDTCYMLAVDAINQGAVDKLLKLKTSMIGRPISVVVANEQMLEEYVEIENKSLVKKLLPGPYTIIANAKKKLASGIVSKENTLGVRMPNYIFLIEIVEKLGSPITATSAQIYGDSLPYSLGFLDKLSKDKLKLIDYVHESGELARNGLSTIVNLTTNSLQMQRRESMLTGKLASEWISESEDETREIAKKIFDKSINIYFLLGDLGGGKTVFSKEIGKILGVNEIISSPTFNIYNEYLIENKKFLHFDLYRLERIEDFENLKFLDLFEPNSIACIEWAERIPPWIIKELKASFNKIAIINFEYVDEKTRKISLSNS